MPEMEEDTLMQERPVKTHVCAPERNSRHPRRNVWEGGEWIEKAWFEERRESREGRGERWGKARWRNGISNERRRRRMKRREDREGERDKEEEKERKARDIRRQLRESEGGRRETSFGCKCAEGTW